MTKEEALKLALEALEAGDWYIGQLEMIVYLSDDTGTHEERAKVQAAITALKEALAQPAQEPEPDELTIVYMSGLYDGKKAEREACAKVCEGHDELKYAIQALRARGNT
jgi:hypothetical protein